MSDAAPPAPSGDLLTRKLGPLPTWGWMGVGLALVLAWRVWASRSSSKEKADSTSDGSGNTVTAGYKLPSNIPPQFTNVDERANFGNTFNNQVTDSNNTTSSSVTNPAPVAPPAAAPVPAPPAPSGHYVTVVKYHKGDTKHFGIPSTVYGIAQSAYNKGSLWKSIWNDPKNAALVAKRKKPENIQTGDKFWVADMPPAPAATTTS